MFGCAPLLHRSAPRSVRCPSISPFSFEARLTVIVDEPEVGTAIEQCLRPRPHRRAADGNITFPWSSARVSPHPATLAARTAQQFAGYMAPRMKNITYLRQSRFTKRSGTWKQAAAVILGMSLLATTAHAERPAAPASEADIETARALFNEGMDFRDQHKFDEALAKLRLAHSLGRTPITAYELGATLRMKGKFLEAIEVFREVERLPRDTKESDYAKTSRANATKNIAELGPLLATLNVASSASPPGMTIALDGEAAPAALLGAGAKIDPGHHTLVLAAPRYKSIDIAFDVKPGETKLIPATLTLVDDPGGKPHPPGPQGAEPARSHGWRTAGITAFVFAGAGAVLGTVGGVVAMGAASTADDRCAGAACPTDAFDQVSTGRSFATTSTIGFVVAGVGAAFGIAALVLDGSGSKGPSRESRLRVTAGGIGGSF